AARTIIISICPKIEPRVTTPAVIATHARFRKALIAGLDRQEMVNTFLAGRSTVATPWLSPDDADYRQVEGSIVRYDFDPRLAGQLIGEAGYVRGADGMFHDPSGQLLSVELR